MAKHVTNGRRTQMRSSCELQMALPKGNHANPLRILEPYRKRLTSLKAERVLLVLEENIKNIRVVLGLPDVFNSMERFSIAFGQELCLLLKEHEGLREKYEDTVKLLEEAKRLEKEYEEWLEMKERHGSLFSETSSDSKSDASQADEEHIIRVNGHSMITLRQNLELVKDDLSQSIKNILRKLKSNPTAMKTILEQTRHLGSVKSTFIKELEQLQLIVRERLLTTPAELEERKYYITKVVQRENKILKMKEKLQIEYDLQTKLKAEEAEKQNVVIEQFKESIRSLNEAIVDECSRLLSDASKKITADIKSSESKQKIMLQDAFELRKDIHERLERHFGDEREKRKRKFKLSTEVFNWIQKYDADMGMRQEQYDETLIERDHLSKDLEDLGRHFVVLEKEYLDIMEKRRLAEEAEQQRIDALEAQTAAAVRLQASWRGYRTRKQLKNKNKKGKKGKKK